MQAVDVKKLEQQYSALEQQAGVPGFWDSQETAQATLQQMSSIKSSMDSVRGLQALLADAEAAIELAELAVRPRHHCHRAACRINLLRCSHVLQSC